MRSDMYDARVLIPERSKPSDPSKIQELAYPRALLRSGPYDCRAQDDAYAIQTTSDYMFNNATKQDRYKSMNKPTKPAAPAAALKAAPEQLRPDLLLNAGPPRPVNATPIAVVSGSVAHQQAPVYQSGSEGGFYYNPSDLQAAMIKNEQARAGSYQAQFTTTDKNPNRSYARQADNARADMIANAKAPTMVTTPFSENSPFARF
jgi:hypothetical protein